MNLTINLDGIQEGKNYVIEFCVHEDGVAKVETGCKSALPKKGISIEDFEGKKKEGPKLEDPGKIKKMSDFKVESSIEGKIDGSL